MLRTWLMPVLNGLNNLNTKKVLWEVSVDNSASIKLAEKKGFEFTRNLITNWDGTPSTLLYTKYL